MLSSCADASTGFSTSWPRRPVALICRVAGLGRATTQLRTRTAESSASPGLGDLAWCPPRRRCASVRAGPTTRSRREPGDSLPRWRWIVASASADHRSDLDRPRADSHPGQPCASSPLQGALDAGLRRRAFFPDAASLLRASWQLPGPGSYPDRTFPSSAISAAEAPPAECALLRLVLAVPGSQRRRRARRTSVSRCARLDRTQAAGLLRPAAALLQVLSRAGVSAARCDWSSAAGRCPVRGLRARPAATARDPAR